MAALLVVKRVYLSVEQWVAVLVDSLVASKAAKSADKLVATMAASMARYLVEW
jgi:hypothetical protein